jgi:hypothetical protein
MSHLELKPCRWRRPSTILGRQECLSPIVAAGPYGVMDHSCWMCPVVDHLDPNARAPRRAQAGVVRHLIYHLCPLGPAWRWHLSELLPRLPLFNGLRLMTVAAGDGCAPIGDVLELLAGHDIETRVVANDKDLREMAGYPLLLRELSAYRGEGDVHLYGHAKGASSEAKFDGVREWSRTMLTVLLDYWPAVRRGLVDHACVGLFRRRMHLAGHPGCNWHYSGSWRWARNADWFERRWDAHEYHWASTETQPGSLFAYGESACLFGEFEAGVSALYHDEAWRGWAGAARGAWLAQHAADYRAPGRLIVQEGQAASLEGESDVVQDLYLDALAAFPAATLDQLYEADRRTHSDICEHLTTLHQLASECGHVTEMGTHIGHSTTALLAARPGRLVCYDLARTPAVDVLAKASQGTYFVFWQADVLRVEIEATDLLFIDTVHNYGQLKEELRLHAGKVRRFIVLHDTSTFGEHGESEGERGLWPAVEEFLAGGEWVLRARFYNNNGLTVLERAHSTCTRPAGSPA